MITDGFVAWVRDQDKFHVRERLFRKCLGMDAHVKVVAQPAQHVFEGAVGEIAGLALCIEMTAVEQDRLAARRVIGGGGGRNCGERNQGGQRWNCKSKGGGHGHGVGIKGLQQNCQLIVGSYLALGPTVKLLSSCTVEGKLKQTNPLLCWVGNVHGERQT